MGYEFYIDDVCYPLPPNSFSVEIGNKNTTINLVSGQEVNLRKIPGLKSVSAEFELPTVAYPAAKYPSGYNNPQVFLDQLTALKTSKKVFKVVLLRKINSTALGWDFSLAVTLEDFNQSEEAGNGMDVKVSVKFKEWKDFGTKQVAFKKSTSKTTKKTTVKKSNSKSGGGNYTVIKGDTLSGIAKKKLGKSGRWSEIYKLNKTTIENAAKKHGKKSSSNGHWIYPGTKLKLPKK